MRGIDFDQPLGRLQVARDMHLPGVFPPEREAHHGQGNADRDAGEQRERQRTDQDDVPQEGLPVKGKGLLTEQAR